MDKFKKKMASERPCKTVYPDDSMLSDESDGTSFPAQYSGPAGREPDNPMGPARGITVRRPRRTAPATPDSSHRPLSGDEWLVRRKEMNREHDHATSETEYEERYLSPKSQESSAPVAIANMDNVDNNTNEDQKHLLSTPVRQRMGHIEHADIEEDPRTDGKTPGHTPIPFSGIDGVSFPIREWPIGRSQRNT